MYPQIAREVQRLRGKITVGPSDRPSRSSRLWRDSGGSDEPQRHSGCFWLNEAWTCG